MPTTYKRKNRKQNNVLYTIVTAVLICAVFLSIVASFYLQAEEDAYEMLHVQTKQIKDDLTLQIKSDRENLVTMASFAAKLYANGQDYSLMFDSFKPIGLFARIGILNPDNTFITKDGVFDLNGQISFEDEARIGEHITGRTLSYSMANEEVVRVAVPITVNRKTVGMIYGIIKISAINEKYNNMAKELNAQLFVYDKETGKFIIDTINTSPTELSQLKTREYNDGYSYEQLENSDKGFISFKSIKTGENLYVHYSTIEDFNWGIMLARYENQVFEKTDKTSRDLAIAFLAIVLIIAVYLQIILKSEKARSKLNEVSSKIRKLLLDRNDQYTNITAAMKVANEFLKARSTFFTDTDGEDFYHIVPALRSKLLTGKDRGLFHRAIFKYVADIRNSDHSTSGFVQISPNKHLATTNLELYDFLTKHDIKSVSFAFLADSGNHVSILGAINAKSGNVVQKLVGDIAVCFSIAVYNKKHLNKTELAATTDALTGALNRMSYKKDVLVFNEERSNDFSCVYIDVNELHLINNRYGHAAGDEMLVYIANTLKEVFYGHSIYRMGGDEFLVFLKGTSHDTVVQCIESFEEQLKTKGYNVAVGMSFRTQNTNCEEMAREAEVRMYEAKAQYYQNKEIVKANEDKGQFDYLKTGITEVDAMITVLKEHYNGIYSVSLETDCARRILTPSYMGYKENESDFSKHLERYIEDLVHPDFRRAVMGFLNYDAIKRQIVEGKIPSITYMKADGEMVTLKVYKLNDSTEDVKEVLWVFEKN